MVLLVMIFQAVSEVGQEGMGLMITPSGPPGVT